MTRRRVLWSFVVLAVVAAVLARAIATDRKVAADAASSVSGQVGSILLCELIAQQMPTRCNPLDGQEMEQAINAIRQGTGAETPSHGVRKREYVLKIIDSTSETDPIIKCFALIEYEGFMQYLYLLPIRVGENCTENTFKYAPGSARVENFLHPPENQ